MDHNAHARPSELGALVHERAGPCGRIAAAAVAAAGFLIAAVVAAPAFAGTATNQRPFLFAFDGSDATAGRFTAPRSIAVDDSTGAVYVAHDAAGSAPGFVSKFDSAGTAAGFSALGASSLFAPGAGFTNLLGVAVDNSGGPNDGRVHVSQFGDTRLSAFARGGDLLWSLIPQAQAADVAVDASGHPWVAPRTFGASVTQYESSGSPPDPTGCSIATRAGAIDVDAAGNVYLVPVGIGPVSKLVDAGGCSFTSSTLDPSARNVYADQVGGHIFTVANADFEEYDQSGGLVATYGSDYVQTSGSGSSIAYNGTLDRVYVAQKASGGDPAPLVAAFGARVSGTIPDVATEPASSVGIGSAHFSGTVDPQGQAGSYRFEWRRTDTSWAAAALTSIPDHVAGSSPPQPLPAGPGASAVSFDAEALRGNTSYQVRLVTVNDANGLRSVSGAQGFATSGASAAPAVSINPTTGIEARAATVTGTINPQGDTADWRAQLSTDPDCAGGFSDAGPLHTVSASSSPVAVSATLTGLLPDQHYCVRITATNSAGSTTSAVDSFETDPLVPSRVFSAFAAPRLDTSARLNGRVDPEGAELSYHFEYSADDGASWTALAATTRPDDDTREQIIVSQEATGLSPDTAYRFRFVASNAAGEPDSQGAELGFRTRTSAAVELERSCPNAEVRRQQQTDSYLPDCRGIELVNNPDKGNQNIFAIIGDNSSHPMTSDGDRVLWWVTGGAPGGTTSAGTAFLAQRTPDGWVSRGLAPPPEQQVGGGETGYSAVEATPSFERFVFSTGSFLIPGRSLVRLDRDQHQDVLANYDIPAPADKGRLEVSDDGGHVLVINPDTRQLEDIGTGTGEVVSVMPDGSPSQCGLDVDGQSFAGWSASGQAAGAHWNSGYRRSSTTDAARVYFETRPDADCQGTYGLYERNRATGQTILIDPGTSGRHVEFIRATPDGRQAYFATFSNLDAADQNSGADVYRWDEQSGQSSCLTCVVPNANIRIATGGLSPILISDDFSHVYFQSEERLVPGQGEAGVLNTYVLSGGSVRFVAGPGVDELGTGTFGAGAYLSADGNALVFRAELGGVGGNVTADKLAAGCANQPDDPELAPCRELYRYDDRDGSVECISCRRDGTTTWNFGASPGDDFRISADGGTVAFITGQALVDRDVNQAWDVYRWRDGAVQLLTDGVREFPGGGLQLPRVRAVDADGKNVLFSVAAPGLTGFEQDGLANLYVARVGGGFAPPPRPAPACSGDGCAASPSAAPAAPLIGSLGFAGPGNGPTSRRPRLVLAGRRVITGTRFTLRVKVPARGALTGRGRGVKTIHRRAPKAGSYKLSFSLTKRARRTLARRHRLRVRLRVGFAPSSGARQRARFAVTLRQPKASSSGARQTRAASNDRGAAK